MQLKLYGQHHLNGISYLKSAGPLGVFLHPLFLNILVPFPIFLEHICSNSVESFQWTPSHTSTQIQQEPTYMYMKVNFCSTYIYIHAC